MDFVTDALSHSSPLEDCVIDELEEFKLWALYKWFQDAKKTSKINLKNNAKSYNNTKREHCDAPVKPHRARDALKLSNYTQKNAIHERHK